MLPTLCCSVASDVANFDGSSSLVYRLSTLPSRTSMEIISLKFKTLRNSGTLFHAEGRRDHSLTLVLEKGRLLLYHQKGTTLIHSHLLIVLYFIQISLNTKSITGLFDNLQFALYLILLLNEFM